MARRVQLIGLANALEAEGFALPQHCIDVELEIPTHGAYVLRYRVVIENEDLAKFGRALARVGEAYCPVVVKDQNEEI